MTTGQAEQQEMEAAHLEAGGVGVGVGEVAVDNGA
jgi:hypothetical protein